MYKVFVNDKPLFLTNEIEKETDAWHIALFPESPRNENTYFGTWDMNGNYYAQVQEYPNATLKLTLHTVSVQKEPYFE